MGNSRKNQGRGVASREGKRKGKWGGRGRGGNVTERSRNYLTLQDLTTPKKDEGGGREGNKTPYGSVEKGKLDIGGLIAEGGYEKQMGGRVKKTQEGNTTLKENGGKTSTGGTGHQSDEASGRRVLEATRGPGF